MKGSSCLAIRLCACVLLACPVGCGGDDGFTTGNSPGFDAGGGVGGAAGAAGAAGGAGAAGAAGASGGSQAGGAGAGGSPGSFSVGGTLAGLSADQVVLRNNDSDELALAANGPFAFSAKLPAGAAFAVTVSAQPQNPPQNCTVSKGDGVVGTSDVTSIEVTCKPAGPFSIGGTVTGLFGSGLVLQNNGGDDLPVAADGDFTFAAKVDAGQPYDVSVLTQPSSPEQTCAVGLGTGTAEADVTAVTVLCKLKDTDGDNIPDVSDPFPADPALPKPGKPFTVYAHTASQLFTMDVTSHAITSVGNFKGSGYSGSMTDIALDEYGVLWGVTFNDLYVCDATDASCAKLASLPQMFNGLTMVPRGTLDPHQDALVGIANSGDWYRIKVTGTLQAQLTKIGAYGAGYTNAGDVFSIAGVGTFGAVNKSGGSNVIVTCDPVTGAVQTELGPVTGHTRVYGLAGWQGVVFAFDENGDVLSIDPVTAAVQLLKSTSHAWWGAGVTTRM
jgi:hypothetical protein